MELWDKKVEAIINVSSLYAKYLRLSNLAFASYILFFIVLFTDNFNKFSPTTDLFLIILRCVFALLWIIFFLNSGKCWYVLYKEMGDGINQSEPFGFWLIGIFVFPIMYFYFRIRIGKDVRKFIS